MGREPPAPVARGHSWLRELREDHPRQKVGETPAVEEALPAVAGPPQEAGTSAPVKLRWQWEWLCNKCPLKGKNLPNHGCLHRHPTGGRRYTSKRSGKLGDTSPRKRGATSLFLYRVLQNRRSLSNVGPRAVVQRGRQCSRSFLASAMSARPRRLGARDRQAIWSGSSSGPKGELPF